MGELERVEGGANAQAAKALERAANGMESADTRSAYVRDVTQYLAHVHQTDEALAEGLQSWKAALRSGGASAATVNRKLSGVKTAMRKAAEKLPPEGRRGIEVALAGVRGIRQAKGAIRAEKMLTPEEIEKLIQRLSATGRLFV